jgi:hypothetical protein
MGLGALFGRSRIMEIKEAVIKSALYPFALQVLG